MIKKLSKLICGIIIILELAACSPTPASSPGTSPDEIQTSIARSVTETLRFFTPNPTETPLPSLTPTATLTPTPLPVMVSVSESTICREGPDPNFKQLGSIQVGETSLVLAKDIDGLYWFIANPTKADSFCWITNQFATITGDTAILPVFTSMPTITPTLGPDFYIFFNTTVICGSVNVLEFGVVNTGSISYRSGKLTLIDKITGKTAYYQIKSFYEFNGCFVKPSQYGYPNSFNEIKPGDTYIGIRFSEMNFDVTGHQIVVEITLCSEKNFLGTCVLRTISLTP